jgi:hypothetical protein
MKSTFCVKDTEQFHKSVIYVHCKKKGLNRGFVTNI